MSIEVQSKGIWENGTYRIILIDSIGNWMEKLWKWVTKSDEMTSAWRVSSNSWRR